MRSTLLVSHRNEYSLGDCFVGYNEDTPAAVLLETLYDLHDNIDDESVSIAFPIFLINHDYTMKLEASGIAYYE